VEEDYEWGIMAAYGSVVEAQVVDGDVFVGPRARVGSGVGASGYFGVGWGGGYFARGQEGCGSSCEEGELEGGESCHGWFFLWHGLSGSVEVIFGFVIARLTL
jgi:hypothetical protein